MISEAALHVRPPTLIIERRVDQRQDAAQISHCHAQLLAAAGQTTVSRDLQSVVGDWSQRVVLPERGGGIVYDESRGRVIELASITRRFMALYIDALVVGGVIILVRSALFEAMRKSSPPPGLLELAGVMTWLAYFIILEACWGRTLGKRVLGLRVVTEDLASIRWRAAVLRGAVQVVDVMLTSLVAGFVSMLVSRNCQRIGDHVAGTIVIRERTPSS